MGELIDTLWNVNLSLYTLQSNSRNELIDTLWNVNLIPPDLFRRGKEELIDTLWNVNVGKCGPSTHCLLN